MNKPFAVHLLAVTLAFGMTGCKKNSQLDPRLEGTWKSDADATIAELKKAKTITPEGEAVLRKSSGK